MYEVITGATAAIGVAVFLILAIQGACIRASDFVFDRDGYTTNKKVWLYKLLNYSDGIVWFVLSAFTLLWILLSFVWPMLYLVLAIALVLYVLRGVVRSCKAGLADHVKSMHK